LTLCAFDRRIRFVDPAIVGTARSLLLQYADEFQFGLPAYCFMPDHLHVLAAGESEASDLEAFISNMKQQTAFLFAQAHRARLWQKGYFDRILRSEEETIVVARYILNNPVRAGLVKSFDEYPFSGSNRYTMQQLADAIQTHASDRK
jgi:putative transposase